MDKENLSLEELQKLREQLVKDLENLKDEDKLLAIASMPNTQQMHIINELNKNHELTKHSKMHLETQNYKKEEESKNDEKKMIDIYKTFSGVTVNNVALQARPVSEDAADECSYFCDVNANIENLQFNISYSTNKPPGNSSRKNEIIKELKITLANTVYQLEIQEGLDFLSQYSTNIPTHILFLKSVNKLRTIRKNICNELMKTYNKFLTISIEEPTGQLRMVCKGVAHPTDNFVVYWQIKLNRKTYSARDSFSVEKNFSDKQLIVDTKPIFDKICKRDVKWSKLSEKEKTELFKNAVNLVVEADNKDVTSDTSTSNTENLTI